MPQDKLPVKEFAAKIKAKYPEYKDIEDNELVNKIVLKYPEYKNQIDFGAVKKKEVSGPMPKPAPTGSVPGGSATPSTASQSTEGSGLVPTGYETQADIDLKNKWEQVNNPASTVKFDQKDPVSSVKDSLYGNTKFLSQYGNRKPASESTGQKAQLPLAAKTEITQGEQAARVEKTASVAKFDEAEKLAKEVEGYFRGDTNNANVHLMKLTGVQDPEMFKQMDDKQLEALIRPGNQTDRLSVERIKDARDISKAMQSGRNLEEMAVYFAGLRDPHIARQIELGTQKTNVQNMADILKGAEGKPFITPNALFSEASIGKMLYDMMSNSATIQEVQKNPEMMRQYRAMVPSLINKYPDFGKMYIGNIISQKMEEMGMNNGILNVVTKDEMDKVVAELEKEGKFGIAEKRFYLENLRESGLKNLGRKIMGREYIDTPGLLENTLSSGVKGIQDFGTGAAEVTGLRKALVGEKEMVARDMANRDLNVMVKPKGIWHEVTNSGGQFLGQSLSIGLGGRMMNAYKVIKNADQAVAVMGGLQAYANYIPQARQMFPGEELKQRGYATILATMEMATENIFKDRKVIDGLLGKMKPAIRETIQDFTDKKITSLAAREMISNGFMKAVKDIPEAAKFFTKAVGENTAEEVVMQLATQVTNGVFTGKPLADYLNAEELLETAKQAALGSPFIGVMSARADMMQAKGVTAKNIYEMAQNPEFWKAKIQEAATLDEDIAKEAPDKIANLEYAAGVLKDISDKEMSDQQKIKYVITSLEAKVKGDQTKGITDPVVKKQAMEVVKSLQTVQEEILTGKDNGAIEGDVSEDELPAEVPAKEEATPVTETPAAEPIPTPDVSIDEEIAALENELADLEMVAQDPDQVDDQILADIEIGRQRLEELYTQKQQNENTNNDQPEVQTDTVGINNGPEAMQDNVQEAVSEERTAEAEGQNGIVSEGDNTGLEKTNIHHQEYTTPSGSHTVKYENGNRKVYKVQGTGKRQKLVEVPMTITKQVNEKGRLVMKQRANPEYNKVLLQHAKAYNYNVGDRAIDKEPPPLRDEQEYAQWAVENSDNPSEIAALWKNTPRMPPALSMAEAAIANVGVGKVSRESFLRFGDRNLINRDMAEHYFGDKGKGKVFGIDQIAQEASGYDEEVQVTPDDVVQFMIRFPRGIDPNRLEKTDVHLMAEKKFMELTGIPLDPGNGRNIIADIAASKYLGDQVLDNSDVDFWDMDPSEIGSWYKRVEENEKQQNEQYAEETTPGESEGQDGTDSGTQTDDGGNTTGDQGTGAATDGRPDNSGQGTEEGQSADQTDEENYTAEDFERELKDLKDEWDDEVPFMVLPTSRKELQTLAREAGLPSGEPSNVLVDLLRIVNTHPSNWTREDFKKIAPHLYVHQSTRAGSENNIDSIMSNGLQKGMVDSVGSLVDGYFTWSRGMLGGEAYFILYRNIKYISRDNAGIKEAKVLFHTTTIKDEDVFDAVKRADKVNFPNPELLDQQGLMTFMSADQNYDQTTKEAFDKVTAAIEATFKGTGVLNGVKVLTGQDFTDAVNAARPGEQMAKPDGTVYGFIFKGVMVLNGDVLNTNTPVHEASHLFTKWAKANSPELYAAGQKLAAGSNMLAWVKKQKFYQDQVARMKDAGKSEAEIEEMYRDEALAFSVGNRGSQIANEEQKSSFRQWLRKFWDKIKGIFKGAKFFENMTAAEFNNMTFDEFSTKVAERILKGEQLQGQAEMADPAFMAAQTPTGERIQSAVQKALAFLPESQVRASLKAVGYSDLLIENIIQNARRMPKYRPLKVPKAGTGPSRVPKNIPKADIKSETWFDRFKDNVRIAKARYFTVNKGMPEFVLPIAEKTSGIKDKTIQDAYRVVKELKAAAKKENFTDWDAVDNVLRSLKDPDGTSLPQTALSTLPASMQPLVVRMRTMIDSLSKDLIVNGYVSPEQALTIEKNIGEYMTRAYKAYNEKSWARKIKKDDRVIDEAFRLLYHIKYGEITSADETLPEADAERQAADLANKQLKQILDGIDEEYGPQKVSSIKGRDNMILKRREDIPKPIRELLGEYTDPGEAFMMTIAKMATLRSQAQFLSSVRDLGMGTMFWEEHDPRRPQEATKEFRSEGSKVWNPLSGLYTTPEIKDFFDASERSRNWLTANWLKLVGGVRVGKTILSVVTQMKNFESNIGFSIMNGHFRFDKSGQPLEYLWDKVKWWNGDKMDSQVIDDAARQGLIGQSVSARELKDMFNNSNTRKIILAASTSKEGLLRKIRNAPGQMYEYASKVYSASDDFFKIYGFVNERIILSKARFDKKFEDLTAEEKNAVDNEAAERVKNTYPTYDRVWEGAKFLAKNAPIYGNFLSFQAESVRVAINNVRYAISDLKSDDPGMKRAGFQRAMGIFTYLTARSAMLYAIAYATGFGMTGLPGGGGDDKDKKRKAINRFVLPFMRSSEIYVVDKGDGKYTVYDITSIEAFNTWFRTMNALEAGSENVKEPGVAAAASEFLSPFGEQEMTFETMMQMVNNDNGKGDKIYREDAGFIDRQLSKAKFAWDKLKPSTIGFIERLGSGSPSDNISALAGLRPYELDILKSFSMNMAKYTEQAVQINKDQFNAMVKAKTAEEANKTAEEATQRIKRLQDEIELDVEAAILLGVDSKLIEEVRERNQRKMVVPWPKGAATSDKEVETYTEKAKRWVKEKKLQ